MSHRARIYGASPAGEGNSPEKAYAAGFVLMLVVLSLNFIVGKLAARRKA